MKSLTQRVSSKKLALPLMAMRKAVYSIILLALISFKVTSTAIHIHLHHQHDPNHEDTCELCEHAINHQDLEFTIPPSAYSIEDSTILDFNTINVFLPDAWVSTIHGKTLLIRPPPSYC